MITREQIRKLAGYSYSRGVDIWRQGKIRRFQIKTTKKGRQIQADVKGSGRNLYDVRILLDEEEDSVQEAWCDCPAFYSYEGLCKHCTAVEEEHMSLSEFLKQRGLEGIQKEISEATDGIKIQENLGSPGNTTASRSDSMLLDGVPKRKTTRQLKELLQKQTARHMLPVLQEESFGKVRLEPLLICDTRECRAEFRIGIGRMYIVKDIFSMIRALREQSSYSYGKSLEFVHIKGSFTEESRPLVEFLEKKGISKNFSIIALWVCVLVFLIVMLVMLMPVLYDNICIGQRSRKLGRSCWMAGDWMDFWMRWETGYFMYSWMERRAVGMSRTQHWNADCS